MTVIRCSGNAAAALIVFLSLAIPALALAQHAPPRLVFHARYWHAIPGWEPVAGDAGYIEFTPGGNIAEDVERIMGSDLKDVEPQWRMLGTNSIKHMPEILDTLINDKKFAIAYLGYDLEYRPQMPEEEQRDPVEACRQARALADQYKLPFLLVPTANVTGEWGEKLAPFADMFQPQGKAYQAYATSLAVYRQRQTYTMLNAAKPGLSIYHDMAMAPKGMNLPLEDLLDYYYGCSDMAIANSIWAMPPHLPMLKEYVLTVRPPANAPEGVSVPVITAPAAVSRARALVGEELTFSAAATDSDALTYTWDFGDHRAWGDGKVLARGQTAKHVYLQPGDYEARVVITNGRGGSARSSVTVSVTIDPAR